MNGYVRLHQIQCLKQLGFSLEQIRQYLDCSSYEPREVVRLHLEHVRRQIVELTKLGNQIAELSQMLDRAETVSPETFLRTIEAMIMFEKYYTAEQLSQLKTRSESLGADRIQEVETEWPKLFAEVQAAMEAGTDPSDPTTQELARRWFSLVREFTAGDPGITQSLSAMYQSEDQVSGMNMSAMRPMMEYIQKAAKAGGLSLL